DGTPSLRTRNTSNRACNSFATAAATGTPPRGSASTTTSGRPAYADSRVASWRPASTRSLNSMLLLPAPPHVILQLALCRRECIAHDRPDVLLGALFDLLAEIRRVADGDLFTRHRDVDVHVEPIAVLMMTMRFPDHDAARDDIRAVRLEFCGPHADILLQPVARL